MNKQIFRIVFHVIQFGMHTHTHIHDKGSFRHGTQQFDLPPFNVLNMTTLYLA